MSLDYFAALSVTKWWQRSLSKNLHVLWGVFMPNLTVSASALSVTIRADSEIKKKKKRGDQNYFAPPFHFNYSLTRTNKKAWNTPMRLNLQQRRSCVYVSVFWRGAPIEFTAFPLPSHHTPPLAISRRGWLWAGDLLLPPIATQQMTGCCLSPRSSERKMDGSSWARTGLRHPSRP